jgi:hypothetical protein
MKKKLLLSCLLAIFYFQISAQIVVPEEQKTLITKVSATWCPPCGGWAWDFFEELIEDNEEKAVLVVAHYSGDLFNTTADEIADNFNAVFQPAFFLNNTLQSSLNSGNASTKRGEFKDEIDANFMNAPLANAGFELALSGKDLTITTKTKFFQPTSGEYYLGVYVIENGVINTQAGRGSDAVHEKILRGAANTDETFGTLITNGSVDANAEFDHTFAMTLGDNWNTDNGDHLEVIAVIWEKVGDDYNFINTNISTDFAMPVATNDLAADVSSMNIFPNVTSTQSTIAIDVENEIEDATLSLFDLSGKKVTDIFQGNIVTGNNTFTIDRNSVAGKGMYVVVLQSGDATMTRKIVFE